MINEGYAMIPRKQKPWEKAYSDKIANLKEKESVAKADRRGMWEYGGL